MQGARSRRVGACVVALILTACHGGGASHFGSTATQVDVKAACAALEGLRRSSDALDGVNISDPVPALAALDKAVDAYSAALSNFERVGPASLRAHAEAVRADVVARHFTLAASATQPIDAWAARHCAS